MVSYSLNSKQLTTLAAVFTTPIQGDIRWDDIVSLLKALGAEKEERKGSKVCFALNNRKILLHRPHPEPVAKKYCVEAVRRFLISAGVDHDEQNDL